MSCMTCLLIMRLLWWNAIKKKILKETLEFTLNQIYAKIYLFFVYKSSNGTWIILNFQKDFLFQPLKKLTDDIWKEITLRIPE